MDEDWETLLKAGEEEPVRTFIASYESDGECGHRIHEGDPAGYVGNTDTPTCGDCLP